MPAVATPVHVLRAKRRTLDAQIQAAERIGRTSDVRRLSDFREWLDARIARATAADKRAG
jgi:hypothetical protein